MNRNVLICDDLLAFAAHLRNEGTRKEYLKAALSYLKEERDRMGSVGELVTKPALLDIKTALKLNRWAVCPNRGDPPLSAIEYIDVRASLLEREIEREDHGEFSFFRFNSAELAFHDVCVRHGLAAVLPYLKACWRDGFIFDMDHMFLVVHAAIRGEAFGLRWQECVEELRDADGQASKNTSSGNFTLIERARQLAHIDRREGRELGQLEAVAAREQKIADDALSHARSLDFAGFLRGAHAVVPIYYTLRDIWYELHFLATQASDVAEFEYRECIVDELQADVGQMMFFPCGGPILSDLRHFSGNSIAHCRRRLSFWENSRVQVNRAIAAHIRARLEASEQRVDGVALAEEVGALMVEALSEGQKLAIDMFDRMLDERIEAEKS